MTPRGMRLERTRRSSFGPSRQLDIGRWVLGLAILAVVVWLGTAFWRATRIEADLAGLDSGAVLTPAAARDLDLELVMPSSGERFRATVRVDDVVISEDLEFEGDTLRLRPAELAESELVKSALSEGEHAIEVAVPRLFLAASTFRWTYEVDSVATRLAVPAAVAPLNIDPPITVRGQIEPNVERTNRVRPLAPADGR